MFKKLSELFNKKSDFQPLVFEINNFEGEIENLTNDDLKKRSDELRKKISDGKNLDEVLPEAFAFVRESAKRTLNQRHFDAQLMGGIALHKGTVAEMKTGEGKTLAATAPVYLNALSGEGAHVVTVNEYLAKRDTVWMGQIYSLLGLSVACLAHEGAFAYDPKHTLKDSDFQNRNSKSDKLDKDRDIKGGFLVHEEFLRPISRKEAYQADITYGTNHEFGFDYLRDNLVYRLEDKVQRGHNFAIIDEVDSILIDEARTPLIIAAPDTESSKFYKTFAGVVARLKKEEDYTVDEKFKSVFITENGITKVEEFLGIKNIYDPENLRLTHYLEACLKAKEIFLRDRDYVVKDNGIVLVDQFTGRLMHGRRLSSGLHQAIEAKENVLVNQESRTFASISIQNYFRLYKKIGGMTGTAQTSAEEFHKVYNLDVVSIPTNKPMVRDDRGDLIYKNKEAKFKAIVHDIRERNEKGQPVLIGTVSIEKNEELSRELSLAGLKHEILNAKNNEREGAIIAQAGHFGAITVATNMAGRGVDIILGGNPPKDDEADRVRKAGGLHVLGTERHESRRIDDQLRGRAGRQGDPGSSQFFLSMEDDLMRVFGGERIKNLMQTLKVPDDVPIQAGMVSRAISQAQSKVEGMNFDARKHLLDYDDVLNKQRLVIYKKRDELLTSSSEPLILSALDMFWMNHLENMEALQELVRLRAYGQHDPLVEYRKEGHGLFQQLLADFEKWTEENKEKIKEHEEFHAMRNKDIKLQHSHNPVMGFNDKKIALQGAKKIGRNDPCPCGNGKKYKKCHGK